MRRLSNPFLALTLVIVLTAGVPVPRVIPIDPATCADMCRVEATCAPCPGASEELPCRESRAVDCGTCVTCQCGVGVLAPDVGMPPPQAAETEYAVPARLLHPISPEPAFPPPKTSV